MKEKEYCILGEGFCKWCRSCIIRRKNEGVDYNEH